MVIAGHDNTYGVLGCGRARLLRAADIFGHRINKLLQPRRRCRALRRFDAEARGHCPGHIQHLAWLDRPPMIGHRAGEREGALGDIEPIHCLHVGAQSRLAPATVTELPGVGEASDIAREEISIQRKDDAGLEEKS